MSSAVSAISSSAATAAQAADTASRVPVQTLGQEDFLKLLVTQMTSQDPMNPQKDTDFIAQMAQFSSLEQTKTLQQDVAGVGARQAVLEATGLLGHTVTVSTGDTTTAQGQVTAVKVDAGVPKLVIGGSSYDLSQVLTVAPTPANIATSTP
jgi:flagellar basal-body rod modification protein FlgD